MRSSATRLSSSNLAKSPSGNVDRKLRGRILLLDDSIGVWMSGEKLSLSVKAPLNTTLARLVGESGEEFEEKNIFKSRRTNVGVYAAIA